MALEGFQRLFDLSAKRVLENYCGQQQQSALTFSSIEKYPDLRKKE
jgi:hypothetical protein